MMFTLPKSAEGTSGAGLPAAVIAIVWLVIVLCMPATVAAQPRPYSDSRTLALLPPYCKYTQLQGSLSDEVRAGIDPAETDRWRRQLGDTFQHLHHYCWGLNNINNAKFFTARDAREHRHQWALAVGEFTYVLQRMPTTHVLMPEVLTKRGEANLQIKSIEAAVSDLVRAISLKPDYWPAYAAMSDCYKQLGDMAKAREWLEKGLAQAPGSKTLKSMLADLGKTSAGTSTPSTGAKGKAVSTPDAGEAGAPQAASPTLPGDSK